MKIIRKNEKILENIRKNENYYIFFNFYIYMYYNNYFFIYY